MLKCPRVVFIDADPASTAAAEKVFHMATIHWCLWHLYKNFVKNLASKLDLTSFMKKFRNAQRQISERAFWQLYETLRVEYPQAESYLSRELSKNVKFWAGFACRVFTGGCQSTQRGESQNRAIKMHLRANSSLQQLFKAVVNKDIWEDARDALASARSGMQLRTAGNIASDLIPSVFQEMQDKLTTYGLSLFVKQVQKSTVYNVYHCGLEGRTWHLEDVSMSGKHEFSGFH